MKDIHKFKSNGEDMLAVLVQSNATGIKLVSSLKKPNVLDCFNSSLVYSYHGGHQGFVHLDSIGFKWNILGEIVRTKDNDIGFETNQLIDGIQLIKDFESQTGLLWKNSYGEEPFIDSEPVLKEETELWINWQEAESRLIPKDKKVIILKEVK